MTTKLDLSETRQELNKEITDARQELKQEIRDVRQEMHQEFKIIRFEMHQLRSDLTIKLGAIMVGGIAATATLIKLF